MITIDGKRLLSLIMVVCIQLCCMPKKALTLSEDAYDIGISAEHRDVIKQLFNAMVQMKEPQDRPPRDVTLRSDWQDMETAT